MSSFNDKLKTISVLEVFGITFAILISIIITDIDETWMYVLIVAYILFRTRHHFSGLKEDLIHFTDKLPFKTIILLTITNIIFALATNYITDYLLTLYPNLEFLPGNESVPAGLTIAYLMYIFSGAIVAPISEEFIFRGVLLNRLNRLFPMIIAIISSSILFGLMHGFSGLIHAFVFGVCMSVVYLKTQNIFASISIHFLNNFIAVIFELIPGIDHYFENPIVITIIGFLSIISTIYILKFIINSYPEIKLNSAN